MDEIIVQKWVVVKRAEISDGHVFWHCTLDNIEKINLIWILFYNKHFLAIVADEQEDNEFEFMVDGFTNAWTMPQWIYTHRGWIQIM